MKNMIDLRRVLSEDIDKLRNDETTPAKLNAITNAVGKILSSVKLELEYARMIGAKPLVEMLLPEKSGEK